MIPIYYVSGLCVRESMHGWLSRICQFQNGRTCRPRQRLKLSDCRSSQTKSPAFLTLHLPWLFELACPILNISSSHLSFSFIYSSYGTLSRQSHFSSSSSIQSNVRMYQLSIVEATSQLAYLMALPPKKRAASPSACLPNLSPLISKSQTNP